MGRNPKKLRKKYGRLTVIGKRFRVGDNYQVKVRCNCQDKTETFVWVHHLQSGKKISCGCLELERKRKENAERARKVREQVEAEKRRRKLKHIASDIAWHSDPLSEITDKVYTEINKLTDQIIEKAWHDSDFGLWDERLNVGDTTLEQYRRRVAPILEEHSKFKDNVSRQRDRVWKLLSRRSRHAKHKGMRAIVRAGMMSDALFSRMTAKPLRRGEAEALFSRVKARSLLIHLRRLKTDRGGGITQRLFDPIPAVQEPVRQWLSENRRDRTAGRLRHAAGIVLPPTSLSVDSSVAVG